MIFSIKLLKMSPTLLGVRVLQIWLHCAGLRCQTSKSANRKIVQERIARARTLGHRKYLFTDKLKVHYWASFTQNFRFLSIKMRELELQPQCWQSRLVMGPDPTRAYFWPAVNKRPARLWPRYFLTWAKEIFLTRREKIEKFDVFRRNFTKSTPNHKWLTQPEPQIIDQTWPGSKVFDPDLSLVRHTNAKFVKNLPSRAHSSRALRRRKYLLTHKLKVHHCISFTQFFLDFLSIKMRNLELQPQCWQSSSAH